jgi:hypothetical protein
MPNPHPDRAILADARMLENLAYLLPAIKRHIAAERVLADGYADHVTYALEPTVTERTKPLTGRCTHNIVAGEVLVDCGRMRPCAKHDNPVSLTPTERAAELGMKLDKDLAYFLSRLKVIGRLVSELTVDAQRLGGIRLEKPKRCDAQGRDGAIEWGDPTCTSIPSRGPLCERCSKREYRWRIDHGMPRRADGVWSQEGVAV